MSGHYGYNHRGRILKAGDADGTWTVNVPSLAPDLAWGPVPAVVPDLEPGDSVLLCQLGTTKADLVIVGKLPGTLPSYTDIPGLTAALAAKADETDLVTTQDDVATLETRLTADEASITANGTAITANAAAITSLGTRTTTAEGAITSLGTRMTSAEGRLTTDEAAITLLNTERDYSHGNDYEINHDFLSTLPRAVASSSITLTNGHGYYIKMRTHRAVSLDVVKVCLPVAGAGGTLKIGIYTGSSAAALAFQANTSLSLAVGRQDWALGSPVSLAAGDYLVLGFLATSMTTSPTLSAGPAINATLLNQDGSVLTAVSTVSASLTVLPSTTLDMTALASYNLLTAIPWIAASP